MARTRRPAVLVLLFALVAVVGVLAAGAVPASAGGGCHGRALTDTATTEVQAAGNCFAPTVARVGVGEQVRWLNADGMGHTVTGAAGSFDGGDFGPGDQATWTFNEPGVYPYSCLLHPGMIGAVVVGGGGAAGREKSEAASPAGARSDGVAAPDEPAAAPDAAPANTSATGSAGAAVPERTALVVAVALGLGLGAALVLRRRTPSAPL